MHKVSVIIPIYNVEEFLPKCLDSVINQTYKDLEIICVNDCSQDRCGEILKEYARNDSRIKVINREQNGGVSAARNTGLDAATGEYIYFIDSDDWIDLDYIEKMVEAAIQSNVEIVLNTSVKVYDNSTMTPINESHFSERTYDDVSNVFINAEEGILNILWNTWAHLWKKDFLDRINAGFPEGYIVEDVYFQAITYVHVNNIYVIRESCYNYRKRNFNISSILRVSAIHHFIKVMNKVIDYYENNNIKEDCKIRLIAPELIQDLSGQAGQLIELRQYFLRIQSRVKNNRNLYTNSELKYYNDIINNRPEAFINYRKLNMIELCRENLQKTKESS